MDQTTRRLLEFKNLGMILFNREFRILEVNEAAKKMLANGAKLGAGSDLLDLLPEFVGNEGSIQAVVDKKASDFRLDYVNRLDSAGRRHFLHLVVLPDEENGQGFCIFDDMTERARMFQELNQQKYELLLYKAGLTFPKHFLSESILGDSPAIQRVRETIQKLSKVPSANVLLLGESGTGKDLAARVIHYSSSPAEEPFVDINCAALPETLVESELFGHEKGAFTHAMVSRTGLLEQAGNGTVFLDEIGELPPNMQAKLLSVLETKRFRRLGGNKPIEVKARIIAATNRDLEIEVAEKRFRADLYYRLNVVSLTLPPLRTLGEDILIIASHLLKIFNLEFKKHVKGFTEGARSALLSYAWPGNVRELSNCIERAMIFVERDLIQESDLVMHRPERTSLSVEWTIPPTGISLDEVERRLIASALLHSKGNKSKAARLLGLTRDTLRYRLEKYRLTS